MKQRTKNRGPQLAGIRRGEEHAEQDGEEASPSTWEGEGPPPARRLDPRGPSSDSLARYQPSNSGSLREESSSTTLQSLQRPDGFGFGPADSRRLRQLEQEVEQGSVALRLAQKDIRSARRLARVAIGIALLALLAALKTVL